MTTLVVKAWEEPIGFSDSSPQSGHLRDMGLMLPAQKFDLLIVPERMGLGMGPCLYSQWAELLVQNATIFMWFLQPGYTGSPNASRELGH